MKIIPLEKFNANEFNAFDLDLLLKQANFDYTNQDIKQFDDQRLNIGEFYLSYFGKPLYTEALLAALEAENLIPASIVDLIAFSIAYPDMQRTFPVVAIGSVWGNKPGNQLVPALWGGEKSRELNMCSISTKWVGEDHFLVFKNI